jgi:hypothetical protein
MAQTLRHVANGPISLKKTCSSFKSKLGGGDKE